MNPPHPSREEILHAIDGEIPSPGVADHLASCPACGPASGTLRRVAGALRARAAARLAPPPRSFAPRPPPWRLARRLLPVAAAAAAALAIGAWLLLRRAPPPVVARVEIGSAALPRGVPVRLESSVETGTAPAGIAYPDGTMVYLNRGTRLEGIERRGFRLGSGEVCIATRGGPGFWVRTRRGRVVDLGTVFLVGPGYVSGEQVAVVRGKVLVEFPEDSPEPPSGRGGSFELSAGQTSPVWPRPVIQSADVAARTAWVRDLLFPARLDGEPLGTVFDLLEQVSPYSIEAPPAVRSMRVTGSVGGVSVEAILRGISASFSVEHRIEGNRVVFQESNREEK